MLNSQHSVNDIESKEPIIMDRTLIPVPMDTDDYRRLKVGLISIGVGILLVIIGTLFVITVIG